MNANSQTTINKWLQAAQQQLKIAGITSYPLDALLILEHVTNYNRAHILAHPEKPLTQNDIQQLQKLLTRRINREPIAYILNTYEFYGHNFYVNDNVLIPRPESEAFIELLKDIDDAQNLIDVGCGSGVIGISAKLTLPKLDVTLSDISKAALEVSKQNANNLHASVRCIAQDLLGSQPIHYDILCANLPYIPKTMHLEKELDYEPKIALFSDSNGMAHYEALWEHITVSKPMYVLTECLRTQHEHQSKLAKNNGYALTRTIGLVQQFEHC